MPSKALQIELSMSAMGNDPKAYVDQAATDAAAEVDAKTDFTIIYPNGGTEASPASVGKDYREIIPNPFPNSLVRCRAEIFIGGVWTKTGHYVSASTGYFVHAEQLNKGDITLQTGVGGLILASSYSGSPTNYTSTGGHVTPVPVRVLVWKEKGEIT